TARPAVGGTAQRSFALSSTRGSWDGIGNAYAYQWQRDGVDIPDATGATYTLTPADEGARVRVRVTATNPDGSVAAASGATATVPAAPPVNTARPAISGTAVRSSTLTSTSGAWSGIGNAYAYQWQRDSGAGFVNIAGATDTTYTLSMADEGARVRLLITAANPDGAIAAASGATATVAAAPPANVIRPASGDTA